MHYSDGTEAKLGDRVKGKPYNTPHEIVGEMISLTPGSESCNCQVAFLETGELEKMIREGHGIRALGSGLPGRRYTRNGDAGDAPLLAAIVVIDYGAVGEFELISRAPGSEPDQAV